MQLWKGEGESSDGPCNDLIIIQGLAMAAPGHDKGRINYGFVII